MPKAPVLHALLVLQSGLLSVAPCSLQGLCYPAMYITRFHVRDYEVPDSPELLQVYHTQCSGSRRPTLCKTNTSTLPRSFENIYDPVRRSLAKTAYYTVTMWSLQSKPTSGW
jgi:hypothetical protein